MVVNSAGFWDFSQEHILEPDEVAAVYLPAPYRRPFIMRPTIR
jgi:hypothetical protein